MSPDEFAHTQRAIEHRSTQQVEMLQRIGGALHVLKWAAVFSAGMLLLLVIK